MQSGIWLIGVAMTMATSGFAQSPVPIDRTGLGAAGTMLKPAMALGAFPTFPGSPENTRPYPQSPFPQYTATVNNWFELQMESAIRGNHSDPATDALSVLPEPLLNQGGLVRASRVQVRDGAAFLEGPAKVPAHAESGPQLLD